MELSLYQTLADKTAVYPNKGNIGGLTYALLGLCGESGELANKVKKILRGDKSIAETKEDLKSEIGDILWYIAAVCENLDISLDEVASNNIAKLVSRFDRGVIKGAGDNR